MQTDVAPSLSVGASRSVCQCDRDVRKLCASGHDDRGQVSEVIETPIRYLENVIWVWVLFQFTALRMALLSSGFSLFIVSAVFWYVAARRTL